MQGVRSCPSACGTGMPLSPLPFHPHICLYTAHCGRGGALGEVGAVVGVEVYLVGGAVRDRLLGLEVHERDWVVVGATPERLLADGYREVGRDFPVFLHPKTGEEYALARTERKRGHGYRGFDCNADGVTLLQDLKRRDLSINAIAEAPDGSLIDPCGGQRDLEARLLRHTSPAFVEDPLRVLRVARFAARFAPLGFSVAPQTLDLMRQITSDGELKYLTAERVWRELERALAAPAPAEFLRVLRACDALAVVLPEVDRLFGVPQPEKHHPEIDTGVHTLMALEQAVRLGASQTARCAVLLHDLGKGTTPPQYWPSHRGHEQRSAALAESLCRRLRTPNRYRKLGKLVARYHTHCHRALQLRPETVLELLEALSALRPELGPMEDFLVACEADARGRTGFEDRPYPQTDYLRACRKAVRRPSSKDAIASGVAKGPALGAKLRELRCAAIAQVPKPPLVA